MIDLDSRQLEGEIVALMKRYAELPVAVARTHAQAAIRRASKEAQKILRKNTPPESGGRRGRRRKGEKRSSGALRRSVTTKGKYRPGKIPRAYAVVGYRRGWESRKAIWNEFGTKRGMRPRRMVGRTMDEYAGPAAARIVEELAIGLERAARDKRMEIVAQKIAGRR